MKKVKYIEAVEIVKPGKTAWKYVGIELERNKETISLLCVGTTSWEEIDIKDLDLSSHKIKEADKDRVHHLFTVATKQAQVNVIDAEKNLLRAKRDLLFHQNKIKQFFGKMLEAKPSEDAEYL